MPVCFVFIKSTQRHSHVIGTIGLLIMGMPHAALVLYILYTVLKKKWKSSTSESKLPMSVEHGLLEETLTG